MSPDRLFQYIALASSAYHFLHLASSVDAPGPLQWVAFLSGLLWSVYPLSRASEQWSVWDERQRVWGLFSVGAFLYYLQVDKEFEGWGDVYFFCGRKLQYCSCDYTWNLLGWVKAAVLWNFVLSTALGCQRLFIQLGLDGLLPGEEVVTKESFISVCWRLVPYWLNKWEQQWGAECSSMMFELPHFAIELLVILPCVQILCARMRILAFAHVNPAQQQRDHPGADGNNGARPNDGQAAGVPWHQHAAGLQPHEQAEQHPAQQPPLDPADPIHRLQHPVREDVLGEGQQQGEGGVQDHLLGAEQLPGPQQLHDNLAPNIIKGCWEWTPGHRQLMSRLKCNLRVMAFTVVLFALAAGNALVVPLLLERQILQHPQAAGTEWAGKHLQSNAAAPGLFSRDSLLGYHQALLNGSAADQVMYLERAQAAGATPEQLSVLTRATYFFAEPLACPDERRLLANLQKHTSEISKMRDPHHRSLILLVESALAIMRLSCEKFFVLISMFVSYLLFVEPPPMARALIRLNSRLSTTFQRIILYSFPAVCWLYGAGFVFSAFVSIVFWGGPALHFYDGLRNSITVICIKALQPASEQQVERMGGSCAICWSDMGAAPAATAAAAASRQPPHGDAEPLDRALRQRHVGQQHGPGAAAVAAAAAGGQQLPAAAGGGPALLAQAPQAPVAAGNEGQALPCGHAYHPQCIAQWVSRCHVQAVVPTCPMCQAPIHLEVRWRFPWPWHLAEGVLAPEAGHPGGPDQPQGPFAELQELLHDMPQIMRPEEQMQQQQEPVPFVEMPLPHQ